jgi:hypothetical protein
LCITAELKVTYQVLLPPTTGLAGLGI